MSDFRKPAIKEKVLQFLTLSLTTHISEFDATSPIERFVRMLQDCEFNHKIYKVGKSGSIRHLLYKKTRELIQSYVSNEVVLHPVRLSEQLETSVLLRKRNKEAFKTMFEEYDYRLKGSKEDIKKVTKRAARKKK